LKNEILAVLVVALLVAVLVAASLGASYFTGVGSRQTITTTSFRNMTSTATVITTSVTTFTTSQNIAPPPWNDTEYLTSEYACHEQGIGGGIPCFSANLSIAYVFNCAQEAKSQAGCRAEVSFHAADTRLNYNLTIWYPLVNHNGEPTWANCEYTEIVGGYNIFGYNYAYCISVSQTSFIIAEQAGTYH
jgi:hypothetical protein